jgi:hydroxyacylglutathione hydrolase
MIIEKIEVGSLGVNCYVVAAKENSEAFIIDPGDDAKKIDKVLKKFDLIPKAVINTHGHFDHISADDYWGIPVFIHEKEEIYLKDPKKNLSLFFSFPYSSKSKIMLLKDSDIIEAAGLKLQVLYTPGHTPGGISLLVIEPKDQKVLFSGDTLFCQSVGRTDLGGNQEMILDSIKKKLLVLDDDTVVYPGHGPDSTIGSEKKYNPFLI